MFTTVQCPASPAEHSSGEPLKHQHCARYKAECRVVTKYHLKLYLLPSPTPPPSRRSIQNNTYGTYQCRRAKACSITLKTRRNCQWCRYQRCLAVGMKPSWVLSSDERERRFRKNRDKKEKKEASAAQSAGVSPPPQSPGHAVVLPSLPHHLVTVKTDLFPVSTAASSSPTAPQFATIQMIPSGGLRLENPRPQLLPHTGVIVRQYSRFPPPLQSLPPVDLRVKLEAPSHLGEVAHPVLGLEQQQQQLGQVQKMEGSPLPSPPPLTPFVSEACSFNQRWLLSHSRVPKPSFKLTFAPAQLLALEKEKCWHKTTLKPSQVH